MQQTDASGGAVGDAGFSAFLATLRFGLGASMDPEWVGGGYLEMLSRRVPSPNAAVGAWDLGRRAAGQNDVMDVTYTGEMLQSAFPFSCDAGAAPDAALSGVGKQCGAAIVAAPDFYPKGNGVDGGRDDSTSISIASRQNMMMTTTTTPITKDGGGGVSLAGRVAVVTGASRGIGAAVGRALQAAGVTVIGTSRSPEKHPGHPFELLKLDVSSPRSVAEFASAVRSHPAIRARGGGIDILVSNAGRDALGGVLPQPAAAKGGNDRFYKGIAEALQVSTYSGGVGVGGDGAGFVCVGGLVAVLSLSVR